MQFNIESKITEKEVSASQLKILQNTPEWKEHLKDHKDAKIEIIKSAESNQEGEYDNSRPLIGGCSCGMVMEKGKNMNAYYLEDDISTGSLAKTVYGGKRENGKMYV